MDYLPCDYISVIIFNVVIIPQPIIFETVVAIIVEC